MDPNKLDIFLNFLECQNVDMNKVTSFISSLKCEEVTNITNITNIMNKIKHIINTSTFNNEYFTMNENFYKYLLNIHIESEQKIVIMYKYFDSSYTFNVLKMEEFENKYRHLPFVIEMIKNNNKNFMKIRDFGDNNDHHVLVNVYVVNEKELIDRYVTISDIISLINLQELNKQTHTENILKMIDSIVVNNNLITQSLNNKEYNIELKNIFDNTDIQLSRCSHDGYEFHHPSTYSSSAYKRQEIYESNINKMTDILYKSETKLILIVEKNKSDYYDVKDILEYNFFVKKYLFYFPETLRCILTSDKYKLYYNGNDSRNAKLFGEKILVIDLDIISINIMDVNNILSKIFNFIEQK